MNRCHVCSVHVSVFWRSHFAAPGTRGERPDQADEAEAIMSGTALTTYALSLSHNCLPMLQATGSG